MKRIFDEDDREFAGCLETQSEDDSCLLESGMKKKKKKRRRRKKKPDSLVKRTLGTWKGNVILSEETLRAIELDHETVAAIQTYHIMLLILFNWNERKPLPYVTVVLDSTDFQETIKNIFFMSLLIKDGYIRLDAIHRNISAVVPIEESEEQKALQVEAMAAAADCHNYILPVDPEGWRKWIQEVKDPKYAITNPQVVAPPEQGKKKKKRKRRKERNRMKVTHQT